MQKSNRKVLEENLRKYLISNGCENDLSKYSYVLKIDKSDEKKLSSNTEEIINFWILPKIINKRLDIAQVMDTLISVKNEVPLWIGVKVIREEIQLIISKRFKKWKVVEHWHKNNPTIPFLNGADLESAKQTIEYQFAYPAGMYENQKIQCEEFQEIVNILNLGEFDYQNIQDKIWENVENPHADILKIDSKDADGEYILIDLWNSDQINVMNCYFKTVGTNSEFVYRSLSRWNERLWKDLGPKVKQIESIEDNEFVRGRRIVNYGNIDDA